MSFAPPPRIRPWTTSRAIHLGGRILLGGFLIQMGVVKALDPFDFLKLLHEYHLLASPQPLNTVAALLPWLEIFCGLLLVAGIATRGAALVVAAMFATFTVAILYRALALHAELDLPFCAIRFDCGCGSGEVLVCAKLIENLVWFALAIWLVSSRHAPRRLVAWR